MAELFEVQEVERNEDGEFEMLSVDPRSRRQRIHEGPEGYAYLNAFLEGDPDGPSPNSGGPGVSAKRAGRPAGMPPAPGTLTRMILDRINSEPGISNVTLAATFGIEQTTCSTSCRNLEMRKFIRKGVVVGPGYRRRVVYWPKAA